MKHLPLGRQDFEGIREEGLVYVDKTRQVADLIDHGRLYFLSRPRRFGKSLLVSLLRHFFSGKRELFEGLYIGESYDYDWPVHPVLSFNLASFGHRVVDLGLMLSRKMEELAEEHDLQLPDIGVAGQLRALVRGIAQQKGQVVLLIDEYDKPIVDFLTDVKQAEANRAALKDFFSPLKELEAEGYLRFLFITGVSKFSKVSLFSDLNNLIDISIDPISHDLLGITPNELQEYFEEHIQDTARQLGLSREDLLAGMKLWYNGYSYDGQTKLYNPFSILNFFHKKDFGNFWFSTGTPTFLVNTIRDKGLDPKVLEQTEVESSFFDKFSLEELDVFGLLFQTGYLTIKNVKREHFDTRYELGYPNIEVRRAMMSNLAEAISQKDGNIEDWQVEQPT